MSLRGAGVLEPVIKVDIDAGFTLLHTLQVPLQLPWQRSQLVTLDLSLLFQLHNQLFPLCAERGVLFAQIFQ
jgi:hypothetical protein